MQICSSCFLFSIITYPGLSGKDVYITNTLSSCQQLPGSGLFPSSAALQGLAESSSQEQQVQVQVCCSAQSTCGACPAASPNCWDAST